jgi:hypothetical protein
VTTIRSPVLLDISGEYPTATALISRIAPRLPIARLSSRAIGLPRDPQRTEAYDEQEGTLASPAPLPVEADQPRTAFVTGSDSGIGHASAVR